jgi:hypothetical protein
MEMSTTIAAIAAALAKAQSAMRHAVKDSINPHFKNRYADLAGVWDACREPLAAAGLSVVQLPSTSDGIVTVRTVLMHASGEWIASDLSVPAAKLDAQGIGSAITYARRYALAAIVGVAQDDDDGEGAVARTTPPALAVDRPAAKRAPDARTPEQAERIRQLASDAGVDPAAAIRDAIGRAPTSARPLSAAEAETVIAALEGSVARVG